MQIVIFILFLIGVGMFLGLAYVGIRALIMAVRGARFAAKDLARVNRESWEKAKADHAAAQAKKQERLRARS